jgi:hypothetical protein
MKVTTRDELESAKNKGINDIIVEGELASKLKTSKRIAQLGAASIAVLVGIVGLSPFTGGLSFIGLAPFAALTGLEISAIIIAASIGLALIIAVFRDYEEISYEPGPPQRLVLKKRR